MPTPQARTTACACIFTAVLLIGGHAPATQERPATATPPGAPAASGQEQPPPAHQPPRLRTEVNYVRVDVYPTTRGGVPVQDLTLEDFEVSEDGTRQTVQAFEHVVVSPAGPQSLRAEPGSVRAGEQMAANPRTRVFVFFLDVPHVSVEGSHRIKEPLIRLLDRILGPDDLIAVMTPEMSAAQISLARKTEVIADMLRDKWTWGARHSIVPMDSREREYEACYPPTQDEALAGHAIAPVVKKMIARRRERMVLDALHDLVKYLGGVREERKAIVSISNGWLLYRPDASLTDLRQDKVSGAYEPIPGTPPIGVDERGKLRINPPRREPGEYNADQTVCDRERMFLASIDNEHHFRYLLDVANRNNASFYPIDPRGLEVFDYPIGSEAPPSLTVDQAHLRTRIESLQTLAENTDGIAVVNSNDLDNGLRRMADDLTSYYLLGYYSSNTTLDGRYRRISVRVKRPGVQVRARRGYRAATADEVSASRRAAAAPAADAVRTAAAALATLGRIRPDQRFAVHALPIRGATGEVTELWIAGEIQAAARELTSGATALVELSGGASGTATATLEPGERAFLIKIPVAGPAAAIDVKVRVASDATATPVAEAVRVEPEHQATQVLLFRRGATTGNRAQPAADFRFSRTERLRLELPIRAGVTTGTGRLLDRNAQPLQVPVQVADRTDAEGQRWLTADVALAPLGAGDYLVEVTFAATGTEQRVLTAIRVTR